MEIYCLRSIERLTNIFSYRAYLKLARVSWIRDVSVAADVLIAAISVDANVLDTHRAVIYR